VFEFSAALFGTVSALFPIYARDILETGAWGAGVLRSAPALGALIGAAVLARIPIRHGGGLWLYSGFALTGVATLVFSVSIAWCCRLRPDAGRHRDIVSTVIRQTLIQMTTPDTCAAGCSRSIRCSTAPPVTSARSRRRHGRYIGAIGSAAIGGVAIVATVALWAWLFPALRRVDRPDEPQPLERIKRRG